MIFYKYNSQIGPTPNSVVHDLLQAFNHAHLLNSKDRKKLKTTLKKTAFTPDQIDRAMQFLEV